MVRNECAGCGHPVLTVFADLGETPLADVFESDPASAVNLPRYRLRAATCDKCGLAQLLDVVDDHLLYGVDYGFRTGGSPSSLSYMADLAEFAHKHAPDGVAVEIGCNDGTLLRELRKLGRITAGFDPSAIAAEVDARQDLNIAAVPFTAEVGRQWGQPAALVVAANVAAHVADPHDFLEGIAAILAPGGIAVVEFQYLPDLLAGCMFDLIYHEHRFFYSFGSFRDLAAQHGLSVRGVGRTPAQGGSLRVQLSNVSDGISHGEGIAGHELESLRGLLAGFQDRTWYARNLIRETVLFYPGTVYGYAASAKSCTLLNYCELGVHDLHVIVDATPSKRGRYTPGSGIQIFLAEDVAPPAAYLLLASNYLSGILQRERAAGYRGKFIVPLPLPVSV